METTSPSRRRGARIAATLCVRIAGIDEELVTRRGNLSATGIYFDVNQDVGSLGTIHALYIGLPNNRKTVHVLGRVVRILSVEDIPNGRRIMGVAFEFLLTSDARRAEVGALLHALGEDQREREQVSLDHALPAKIERADGDGGDAVVYSMNLHELTLETSWPVTPGEVIECTVISPRSRREIAFSGNVVDTVLTGYKNTEDRYRVNVRFRQEPGARVATGSSIADAITFLLHESIAPDPTTRPARMMGGMAGNTQHVPLTSLMSFADMEQMTGVLFVSASNNGGRIYFSKGRIVDATLERDSVDVRNDLSAMVTWPRATFRFKAEEVSRPDRVNSSTTAVLLELARIQDEQG